MIFSPSMTASNREDHQLKVALLDDTLTIIDMEEMYFIYKFYDFISLEGTEEQIGGYDLIYRGMPVSLPTNSVFSTFLGCHNNRKSNLKKLAKSAAVRLAADHKTRGKND